MAEHTIETRILLRYDTYSRWMNSNTILKQGEAAVAAFPRDRILENLSNSTPDNTPPAIGIKMGDGIHYFRELPWVQAIAADVYGWAKTATKPIYTAQEIQGLQSFIEAFVGGDTDITIAPRIYQIVQGENENQYKYYLRYKENNEDSPWIVDTSSYIDLEDIQRIRRWLGDTNLTEYPNLLSLNVIQIRAFLATLKYEDTARDHQFVTSVSEENGIISVERARPVFDDIGGVASVSQGGTGKASLNEDEVLVGNGTDPVRTIPIADSIAANNYLVPNYVIKQYIDNATAGVTGAMHFIGEAGVVITPNSGINPQISGYDFTNAQPGDVILSGQKEFVWTGGGWHLLGDEGSYAVRGSIRDADIDPEAAIAQSKIANLGDTFAGKVDKVEGKSLTSNDFTDELKQKLVEIEEGAQRNVIEHIFVNNEEVLPTTVESQPNSINLQIREVDDAALEKLATIQVGAQVNKIEKIVYDGEEVVPDENKVVSIVSDPHTEHENKIEQIFINNTEYVPNREKQVRITLDEAALNLSVIKGARVPNSGLYEDVDITPEKKLELSRIAKTGNIVDIIQDSSTFVILDCGTSTSVL